MKILQVIHDFLPSRAAGAEIYCANLAHELSGKHEIVIFYTALSPSDRSPRLRKGRFRGLRVYEARTDRSAPDFRSSYSHPGLERIFDDILRKENFDLVHIHHLLYHSLGYPRIARRRSLPVIFTLHDYYLACPTPDGGKLLRKDLSRCPGPEAPACAECLSRLPARPPRAAGLPALRLILPPGLHPLFSRLRRRLPLALMAALDGLINPGAPSPGPVRPAEIEARREYLERDLIPNVDLFTSPSRHLRQRFVGFGFPEDRIIHLNNGIPFEPSGRRRRKPSGPIRFGFAGSLIPSKGADLLVEAFLSLPRSGSRLLLFGDPTLAPRYALGLKRRARKAPVSFHGPLHPEEMPRAYAEMDCLVAPSTWEENSPLVIREALAFGVPVVAADLGGIPELVQDGRNGFLFEAGNREDLRNKMEKIILEPQLLLAMRNQAPPVKTIKANAEEIEKIYRDLKANPSV